MKLLTKILPLALLIAGFAGCLKEKIEPVPAVQGEAAFTVSVPGMQTPSTRALDPAKEKQLTAIDVVIFSNTDNKIVEHHRVDASDIGVGTGGNDYQFRVKGIENTANVTLAVIANAPTEVAAAVGSGTSKTDFLSALKVSADAKWDTNAVGYRTIPMYGEITVAGNIYDAVTNTVNLTRMLAKVDVLNNVAPESPASPADGDFELTAVHVVNRNTAGLIAPKWNATTGAPEPPPATTPNFPAGFAPGMVTWADGNQLTYTLSTGHASLENEIYLFESAALSANPQTPNGLRLVFEGNYTSGGVTKRYYYPVDFTAPGGAYMPVLRNHRYLFTITEAAGRGYDGLGEAVAAFGVMSNLRTSLVVVDESGIRHMVWNGEHFLGVSEKSFTVAAAGQQNIELQISTNYTGGWTASVENPAVNSWLTLTGGVSTITGLSSDRSLTFNVATSTEEWDFKEGVIRLTAGRLHLLVTIKQGDYKIVAETSDSYPLDGEEHSFKIKVNYPWTAEIVSKGSVAGQDVITNLITTGGSPNTTDGAVVKFQTADYFTNRSFYMGTAQIKIKSVNGEFPDQTIDIPCISGIKQTESNCYMVKPNGLGVLIPVSRANASSLGAQINNGNTFAAEFVWSDIAAGVANNGAIKAIVPIVSSTVADSWILVMPGTSEGNATVALTMGTGINKIKWSWHIWVTNYTPAPADTWMTYNLGALATTWTVTPNTSTRGDKVQGLYYQWGRKDPFPSTNSTPAGTSITFSPGNSFATSVQNPVCFLTENWGGSNSVGSWDNGSANYKTVYDPCPQGWRVPRAADYGAAANWGAFSNYGRVFSVNGQFFPAAGIRYKDGSIIYTSTDGYYWAANVLNNAYAYCLYFASLSITTQYNTYMPDGFPIRCVRSNNE